MKKGFTLMVMAGGTGGHVFPALAVAQRLIELGGHAVWLGDPAGMEGRIVGDAGIEMEPIRVRRLRGRGPVDWLMAPWRIARAVLRARRAFRRVRPDVVLGMGGFVAGPGGLAAWLGGYPLVVHEQNAVPGLTNRVLARLADRVLEAMPGSFGRPEVVATGNPVRREIAAIAGPRERFDGRTGAMRLLVLGGSQGAKALNETLPAALEQMPAGTRPEVRHQCGRRWLTPVRGDYARRGVEARVDDFIDDMAAAYAWADLVVCRAGALTVAELAATGVGSILVPFPAAVDDHQTANARFLARRQAALLVPQSELTPASLAERLQSLAADRTELLRMAERAREAGRPDATRRVLAACLEMAGVPLEEEA